eukprot:1576081-Rhodomonas_salina.2
MLVLKPSACCSQDWVWPVGMYVANFTSKKSRTGERHSKSGSKQKPGGVSSLKSRFDIAQVVRTG